MISARGNHVAGSDAAIKRTAKYGTGWQAGPETPEEAGVIVRAIKTAAAEAGRQIDDYHFGAGFPFYFGSATDPAPDRMIEAYKRRTGRDAARLIAVGDAEAIVDRVAEYVHAGVSKFVLRPVGGNENELLAQTGRLIEEVLPRIANRWPKPVKRTRLVG